MPFLHFLFLFLVPRSLSHVFQCTCLFVLMKRWTEPLTGVPSLCCMGRDLHGEKDHNFLPCLGYISNSLGQHTRPSKIQSLHTSRFISLYSFPIHGSATLNSLQMHRCQLSCLRSSTCGFCFNPFLSTPSSSSLLLGWWNFLSFVKKAPISSSSLFDQHFDPISLTTDSTRAACCVICLPHWIMSF